MDKTRQERYNMIYGNTARKIEDLAAEPVRRQPRKTRKARPRREHQVKESTRQNQKRAMSIDLAFIKVLVAGLCVIAVASFFLSVRAYESFESKSGSYGCKDTVEHAAGRE